MNLLFRLVSCLCCLLIFSCQKEKAEFSVDFDDLPNSIRYNQILKIRSNKQLVRWQSSDPFVAIIDNDGNLHGQHIGKTIISAKTDGQTLEKELLVIPYVENIKEPFPLFGAPMQDIIQAERQKPKEETLVVLSFDNTGPYTLSNYYAFTQDKLFHCGIQFNQDPNLNLNDIRTFYLERYRAFYKSGKLSYFLDKLEQVIVVLDQDEKGKWFALYERPNINQK